MLIGKDGSVHMADGMVFCRTTKAKPFLRDESPAFRGILDETGSGELDSAGPILDEAGRKFRVTLSFEDGFLKEVVLDPILDNVPEGSKKRELQRKSESERILAALFGTPNRVSEFRTEYALYKALVYTYVNWNPRYYDGGGICISYCN